MSCDPALSWNIAMFPFHHHHRIPINNSKDEIADIDTDN